MLLSTLLLLLVLVVVVVLLLNLVLSGFSASRREEVEQSEDFLASCFCCSRSLSSVFLSTRLRNLVISRMPPLRGLPPSLLTSGDLPASDLDLDLDFGVVKVSDKWGSVAGNEIRLIET